MEADLTGRYLVDDLGEQDVLLDLDSGVQRVGGVFRKYGDSGLSNDRPRVDAGIDDVHRAATESNARSNCLLGCVVTGERGKDGGVHVDDAACKPINEGGRENTHESSQDNEIRLQGGYLRGDLAIPSIPVVAHPECHDANGDASPLGVLQSSGLFAIRDHANDVGPTRSRVNGAADCAKIGTATRH